VAAVLGGVDEGQRDDKLFKMVAALQRAVAFRRFRASDVRSILLAGAGVATPCPAGEPLTLDLPAVPERPLSDYGLAVLA